MCHNSYDRLIDLAQRTGDRLIVHDPIEGRDIVIMDVGEYEKLIDGKNKFECEDHKDIRSLSSDQMLDQINRDIAIWRAEKEDEEEWERDMVLEDEFDDEPPFDPFSEEDYHPADWHNNPLDYDKKPDPWHSAGSVLGNRYDDFTPFDAPALFEDDEEADFNFEDWNTEDNPDLTTGDESVDKSDEIKIEDIPFDSDFKITKEDLKNIPLSDINDPTDSWEEEPLGDEDPVFYEEPV